MTPPIDELRHDFGPPSAAPLPDIAIKGGPLIRYDGSVREMVRYQQSGTIKLDGDTITQSLSRGGENGRVQPKPTTCGAFRYAHDERRIAAFERAPAQRLGEQVGRFDTKVVVTLDVRSHPAGEMREIELSAMNVI